MGLLVDYRCADCSGRTEHWVAHPIPADRRCPACHGAAHRLFGLGRLGRSGGTEPTAPSAEPSSADLCLQNSRAPGICHMSPSAARRWAAMGRGDNRAVEREIAYQEASIAAGTMTPGSAFSHSHAPAAEPVTAPAGGAR